MRKILIIDDNPTERELLSCILSDEYTVVAVSTAKEAFKLLLDKANTVSAIMLDIIMPEIDGFEVLKRIQANTVWSQIPVIVCTALSDLETQEKAIELGAYSIALKPYNSSLIHSSLRNCIRLRETSSIINSLKRDKLTGIYNRENFFIEAEKMIKSKEAGYYMLACFNIENFKVINDQYGTQKGDEVLIHVAKCISECAETVNGICCRFMADRFGLLYPSVYKGTEVMVKSHTGSSEPPCISHKIKVRIGRYLVDDLELSVSSMYDRATLAEESIRGRYDLYITQYNDEMRDKLIKEQHIINTMNDALQEGHFIPWFQPQYNHATGAIIGAEALVRWKKPDSDTFMPPMEFIPIFERNGFIYELDKAIWEQSCFVLRRWLDEGREVLPISVNISRYDIFHDDFVEFITNLVIRYEIPVNLLRLEITESAFSEAPEQIVATVKELIDFGFTLEIDDFGSGYSSLNTLKDVPAQILKLDMRFLSGHDDTERGGSILESIIRMAKWIGMSVIAEGVEEKSQADYLKSIGCYYVQGYYYAKPMPLEDYEALLDKNNVEIGLSQLQTVETFDNSAFWNPKSMDSLIFNSYIGSASIFEFHNGTTETLRVTDSFLQMLGMNSMDGMTISELNPENVLDERNLKILYDNLYKAIETRKESTCEIVAHSLDKENSQTLYLRCTSRILAKTDERYLSYNVVMNITDMRVAEQKERIVSERIHAIMDNTDCGISAVTLKQDGGADYIFVNDKYCELHGCTKEEIDSVIDFAKLTMNPEDYEKYIPEIKKLNKPGQKGSFKFRVKRKGRRVIWLRVVISVIVFDDIDIPVQLSSFTDITAEMEASAKERETTEQIVFLNDMAGKLLANTDAEAGINDLLKELLRYFEATRAYIIEIDKETALCNINYEVYADGIEPINKKFVDFPLDHAKLWMRSFDKSGTLTIINTDEISDEFADSRKILKSHNIKSLISAALKRNGNIIGSISIDNPNYRQGQIERLSALGDYVSVMLTRIKLNNVIDEENRSIIDVMDNIPGGFVRFRAYPEGTIIPIYRSEGFFKLIGVKGGTVEKITEDDVYSIIHPDDVDIVRNAVKTALEKGEVNNLKYRICCSNGDFVRVFSYGKIFKTKSGKTFLNMFYSEIEE